MPVEISDRVQVGLSAKPAVKDYKEEPVSSLGGMANLWQLRNLTLLMVQQELVGRYKGSILGALWPLLNPLGHMALYTFLFGIIFQVRFGGASGTTNFALYLMAAYLPWTAMAEALSNCSTKILEMPNLVKKVVFPTEILPLVCCMASFVNGAIALAVFIAFSLIVQHHIPATVLLLPLVFVPHFLFTAGLGWFLGSLGVFVRDCRHVLAIGLSAWMYATPIVFPAEKLPENLKFLLWINPVASMVQDYRRLLLEGSLPELTPYLVYAGISLAVFVFGFHFFFKTKKSFADVM